ncbi:HAMP domain-containing protein [Sphingomonas changnyeongensis]|uniref:HAMP domain-containing protein n=1 Tax=Sphingomonas changnyeongensis TaxID=2698679 RepID=A0A7Z2NW47_9SPHN|nr:methyl-accepting chemotaxis protein [Sphingomonas changnyeongensis]QHL90875.1 HAMP domain-containing protein [Sphingomonas changnyeongensis]
MLKSLSLPRKLGLSFMLICVSAAIMMAVFFANISMIRSTTDQNNQSQSIHAQALALETALLRQNSQLRGYLVTGDDSYLKSYDEGRDEYDRTSAELEKTLTEAAHRTALLKSREETLAWREKWGDRLIRMVKSGQRDRAQEEVRAAGKAVLVTNAVLPLRDIRDAQVELSKKNGELQEGAISSATTALVLGGLALIGIAIGLAVMLSRAIAKPITDLTRVMGDLAAGRNDINVPDTDRGDELGNMARAVLVFRDAALAKQKADAAAAEAEAVQKLVVDTVSSQLSALAGGDLTVQIDADFPGSYATVKTNFNAAVSALRDLIASVSQTTASIRTGSGEIAQASEDLARRTEANAASLEETSAAVAEMDQRLKATAEAARRTVERADGAIATVSGGRSTADQAVQAMTRVADSAKGIDSVIEGLDKIAFQTRVLAMNAAVEAGRAGEAGRGFAVVADLVSALAMRSEEEAARARDQLTSTQTDIGAAVEAIHRVDTALADISTDVGEVHQLLAGMANDNQAQAAAISEISTAIGSMDQSTQQNAAMVEETSAAARNLASEVDALSEQALRFKISDQLGTAARMRSPVLSTTAPTRPLPAAAVRALSRPAAATADDDWTNF